MKPLYLLRSARGGKVVYWTGADVMSAAGEWEEDRRLARRMTYRGAWRELLDWRQCSNEDGRTIGMDPAAKIVRMKRRVKP